MAQQQQPLKRASFGANMRHRQIQAYNPLKKREGAIQLEGLLLESHRSLSGARYMSTIQVTNIMELRANLTSTNPRARQLSYVLHGSDGIRMTSAWAKPKEAAPIQCELPVVDDFVFRQNGVYLFVSFKPYEGDHVTRVVVEGVHFNPFPQTGDRPRNNSAQYSMTLSNNFNQFYMIQNDDKVWQEAPKTPDGIYDMDKIVSGTWMQFDRKMLCATVKNCKENHLPADQRLPALLYPPTDWSLPVMSPDNNYYDDRTPQIHLVKLTKRPGEPQLADGFLGTAIFEGWNSTTNGFQADHEGAFFYVALRDSKELIQLRVRYEFDQWNASAAVAQKVAAGTEEDPMPSDLQHGRADIRLYPENCHTSGITNTETWKHQMQGDAFDVWVVVRVNTYETMETLENGNLDDSPYPLGYFKVSVLHTAWCLHEYFAEGPQRRAAPVTLECVRDFYFKGKKFGFYQPEEGYASNDASVKTPVQNPLNLAQGDIRNLSEMRVHDDVSEYFDPRNGWHFAYKNAAWDNTEIAAAATMTPEEGALALQGKDRSKVVVKPKDNIVLYAYRPRPKVTLPSSTTTQQQQENVAAAPPTLPTSVAAGDTLPEPMQTEDSPAHNRKPSSSSISGLPSTILGKRARPSSPTHRGKQSAAGLASQQPMGESKTRPTKRTRTTHRSHSGNKPSVSSSSPAAANTQ